MELELTSSFLRSRDAFESLKPHLDLRQYSSVFGKVVETIDRYYERDKDAKRVDHDLLLEQVFQTLSNDKHKKMYQEFVGRSLALDTSPPNIQALLLGAKRAESSRRLSEALSHPERPERIDILLEEYQKLRSSETGLDEALGKEGIRVLSGTGSSAEAPPRGWEERLRLFPKSLDLVVEDGLGPGDHVVIYGDTEIGKSALACTISCGFLMQGSSVLWIENEENAERTRGRFRCNLAGVPKEYDRANPEETAALAASRGGDLLTLVDMTGYGFREIEDYIKEIKPKAIVVNQIHNVVTKSDNEVLRREKCAQSVRDLSKKYNLVGISITQAAESARGRAYLELGDVFMNNTGIQGTADLLLGIGASADMMDLNERGLSTPKNKISFRHEKWITRINTPLSRIESIRTSQ